MILENSKKLAVVIIGSALYAISMNFFLIPAEVLASGFAGIGQIVHKLTTVSPGTVILILNIPVMIIGWLKLASLLLYIVFSLCSYLLFS